MHKFFGECLGHIEAFIFTENTDVRHLDKKLKGTSEASLFNEKNTTNKNRVNHFCMVVSEIPNIIFIFTLLELFETRL